MVALGALAAVLLRPGSSSGAESAEPQTQVFTVAGTNGYKLSVLAPAEGSSGSGEVGLGVFVQRGRSAGVSYAATGKVTATRIRIDLGDLGSIDVTRVPTGRKKAIAGDCEGGGKTTVEVDRFEGTIDFHGEEGFTDVEATNAPGYSGPFFCGYPEGGRPAGKKLPGARLDVERRGESYEVSFDAVRDRPRAKAVIDAEVKEMIGGMEIHRFAVVRAGRSAFDYDRELHTATVSPPAPFSGTARFVHRPGAVELAPGRWSGDLTVDLPGHAGIPVTGPGFRASLGHPTS